MYWSTPKYLSWTNTYLHLAVNGLTVHVQGSRRLMSCSQRNRPTVFSIQALCWLREGANLQPGRDGRRSRWRWSRGRVWFVSQQVVYGPLEGGNHIFPLQPLYGTFELYSDFPCKGRHVLLSLVQINDNSFWLQDTCETLIGSFCWDIF